MGDLPVRVYDDIKGNLPTRLRKLVPFVVAAAIVGYLAFSIFRPTGTSTESQTAVVKDAQAPVLVAPQGTGNINARDINAPILQMNNSTGSPSINTNIQGPQGVGMIVRTMAQAAPSPSSVDPVPLGMSENVVHITGVMTPSGPLILQANPNFVVQRRANDAISEVTYILSPLSTFPKNVNPNLTPIEFTQPLHVPILLDGTPSWIKQLDESRKTVEVHWFVNGLETWNHTFSIGPTQGAESAWITISAEALNQGLLEK